MSAGPRLGDDIERGKTLEFSQSVTYPGTVDEVVAMFLSSGYQERRFGSFVVEGSSSTVVEGERITFSGTVRPELIPPAASRFVKGDLRVTFVEEWSREEAVARSRSTVTVEGAPVSFRAVSVLSPSGQGAERDVTGDVSVRIPLLGGRIEKEAVARAGRVIERERELAASWLEEHRGGLSPLCEDPRPRGTNAGRAGSFGATMVP